MLMEHRGCRYKDWQGRVQGFIACSLAFLALCVFLCTFLQKNTTFNNFAKFSRATQGPKWHGSGSGPLIIILCCFILITKNTKHTTITSSIVSQSPYSQRTRYFTMTNYKLYSNYWLVLPFCQSFTLHEFWQCSQQYVF